MKLTPRSIAVLLAVTSSGIALAVWSARLGRKVWSPQVFAWRNPFKLQPIIKEQANCPVRLVSPRFYSFMSIGSSIGSVLELDVENVSDKPIHSFFVSYDSLDPLDTGGMGIQTETCLQPKQSHTIGNSSRGNDRVTFSVDFVQFADGDVWFATPPKASVKPEGVKTGEQAANKYLREVLESDGAAEVISVLPRIRSKMGLWRFSEEGDFGIFGFHDGINKAVVSVQYAYQQNGLRGVEDFLTKPNNNSVESDQ